MVIFDSFLYVYQRVIGSFSYQKKMLVYWEYHGQRDTKLNQRSKCVTRKIVGMYTLVNIHNYGKSQSLIGKSTINGPFSIAMLNYQRVVGMYGRVFPDIGNKNVNKYIKASWDILGYIPINHEGSPNKIGNRWGYMIANLLHFFWPHYITISLLYIYIERESHLYSHF